MVIRLLFLSAVVGLFAGVVGADETAALTVDQIVQKANHAAYYQGLDGKSKVSFAGAEATR